MADTPLPVGEYAIVEVLGHRTLIGRISEVERFGAKFISVEPIFRGKLLGAVLLGGSSVYQFTPCSAETAASRGPKSVHHLPSSILCTLPPELLPAPSLMRDVEDDFADEPSRFS